jgi:gas vesicle protein
MNESSKILLAALAGTAAGIIAGMLLAPASGEETRKQLTKKVKAAGESIGDLADTVKSSTEKIAKEVKNKVEATLS